MLSFFIFQKGNGQNSFPAFSDSVKWNVLHCVYGIGYSCNTLTYQYDDDTLFCGHSYSKIKATTTGSSGYIRSDGSRAYIRVNHACSGKEYLMYDFSINTGDTIYLAYNLWNGRNNDSTRFILDSSNTIIYNGLARRVYYLKYNPDPYLQPEWFRQMTWIEGLGSTMHPFFPIECMEDYCESSWQLLCVDSSGVQLYQDALYKTCDTTYTDTGVNDFANESPLIIYPIPFTKYLTVSIENAAISEIDILNHLGERIYQVQGDGKNYLRLEAPDNLNEGVYFIKVHTNKGILTKKMIKTE